MSESPIPDGHDTCVIANVLHTLSPDHILDLLANLRKYMTPGARLLLVDLFTDPGHTDPPIAALLAGEFLLMCKRPLHLSVKRKLVGGCCDRVEGLERRPLSGPISLIVAEAAST